MEILTFDISDNAAARIKHLLQLEQHATMLRITVNGGGCSGFKYDFSFVKAHDDEDHLFRHNDAIVVIDHMSLSNFMQNATLDYVEDLTGAAFVIKNPNSSAKCGCGNSFAI
jgi:iron-sulfur cluster insertion protein